MNTLELNEILIQHLQKLVPNSMPGIDGLTLDVVLESYVQSAISGLVPEKSQLIHRHPELAEEIESLFAGSTKPVEAVPSCRVISPLFFEHTD